MSGVEGEAAGTRAGHATRLLVALGATAALLIGIGWAAGSNVELVHEPPPRSASRSPREPEQPPFEEVAAETSVPLPAVAASGDGNPIGAIIVAVLLIAAAIVIVVMAWRHRPRLRLRVAGEVPEIPDVDDAVVAEAVEAARAELDEALRTGSPRNAIVACWVRLEEAVALSGVAVVASETSSELTARVLARHSVDPSAIGALSTLYREARFSTHELGEDQREAAIAALSQLHETLRAATPISTEVEA